MGTTLRDTTLPYVRLCNRTLLWEVCLRRYRDLDHWHNLRSDAVAEYQAGERRVRFWLEWDRGTMNVRDLVIKFTPYAHYIASREWAREDARLPRLFCVAPDIAQERRMQRVAQTRLAETSGLMLWTTTEVLLKEHGPLLLSGCRAFQHPAKRHSRAVHSDNACSM
jgi:hypothetical protein